MTYNFERKVMVVKAKNKTGRGNIPCRNNVYMYCMYTLEYNVYMYYMYIIEYNVYMYYMYTIEYNVYMYYMYTIKYRPV